MRNRSAPGPEAEPMQEMPPDEVLTKDLPDWMVQRLPRGFSIMAGHVSIKYGSAAVWMLLFVHIGAILFTLAGGWVMYHTYTVDYHDPQGAAAADKGPAAGDPAAS